MVLTRGHFLLMAVLRFPMERYFKPVLPSAHSDVAIHTCIVVLRESIKQANKRIVYVNHVNIRTRTNVCTCLLIGCGMHGCIHLTCPERN